MKFLKELRDIRWSRYLLTSSIFLLSMIVFMRTKLWPHVSLYQSRQVISPTFERAHDLYEKQHNETHALDVKLLHLDGLIHSDSYKQWAPIILSKCMHGMDKQAAPCLKEANRFNIIEAQELIYPAFRLKLPTFVHSSMKTMWITHCRLDNRWRILTDHLWANFAVFRGQNIIFSNAAYRGDPPPDIWSHNACMGTNASYMSFLHDLDGNVTEQTNDISVDTLVIATTPDSWSFQHFMDRVVAVWSQAQLVIPTTAKKDTVIISGETPRDAIVNELYDLIAGQHFHNLKSVYAKRLVFSCRAPLFHPFTTMRITETIFQSLPPSSSSQRNVILFLSRSIGGKTRNGGRQLLNEVEVMKAISAMLNATGRPEQLQYFHHDEFNGLEDIATFMRDRVKMMIGPHGAAFYNSRFAQPRTAVIEIIPDPEKFFSPCFWSQARLLGQDYSVHIGTTQNDALDMTLDDIDSVVQLVQDRLVYLDNSYRVQDALLHTYDWDTEVRPED
ncbi:putative glycosyltransferase 61 [Plasmopara halstedii]